MLMEEICQRAEPEAAAALGLLAALVPYQIDGRPSLPTGATRQAVAA
jgi:hypothetical protein